MNDKLNILRLKRKDKLIEYTKTEAASWKKKLRKLELDVIDLKIKIEKLKTQFE